MASIIPVLPTQAEVMGRTAIDDGRLFVWMSLHHPQPAADIVSDPDNEIQWNGKIYGYRVFRGPITTSLSFLNAVALTSSI